MRARASLIVSVFFGAVVLGVAIVFITATIRAQVSLGPVQSPMFSFIGVIANWNEAPTKIIISDIVPGSMLVCLGPTSSETCTTLRDVRELAAMEPK